MNKHPTLRLLLIVAAVSLVGCSRADPDALSSWNDVPVKTAITDYLAAVTNPHGDDFIPVPERIAVIDNDGTFWCERPGYPSALFQAHLIETLADHGEIDGAVMPYRAWITGDRDALRAYGWRDAYAKMTAAFAAMPCRTFRDSARAFVKRSRHPDYGVSYDKLYYAPMLELARLLTSHDFQVWIVTGAEQDFVRSFVFAATGVPPERVIGSWTPAIAERTGERIEIVRSDTQIYNGHEAKPGNIETRIGRRPVFCAGNSDNDEPMCRYVLTGRQRAFALWIHHDDAKREYAYESRTESMAALIAEFADAYEVDMAEDWGKLFVGNVSK